MPQSSSIQRLARYLSASTYRTVEEIVGELACDRHSVPEHIEALRAFGIKLDAREGQGYLLSESIELLDKDQILAGLEPETGKMLTNLWVEGSLDSTNSALLRLSPAQQHATVILAEHQSGGRGRRGRQWASPFARNLYLSLGWEFDKPLSGLACLPLVVAIATANALSRAGLDGHVIKWPNDLLFDDRKLAGCLVEMQGDSAGPCHAVIGVGINVNMPESEVTARIDQPWTDLNSHLPGISRNGLAALLLQEMVNSLVLFSGKGFLPFQGDWQQLDGLNGKEILVFQGSDQIQGKAIGIDQSGALLLDTGKGILSMHSGEVSLHEPMTGAQC